MGKHKELLTSIRRYYSNAFTDRLKQDAMNLFLGHYIPTRHPVPLWDLENDYYLHNFHVKSGTASMQSMKLHRHAFVASLDDDEMKRYEKAEYDSDSGRTTPVLHRKLSVRRLSTDNKKIQESWRVERIRKRCSVQYDGLSLWWRGAIQSYIEQRCSMHLGGNPFESMMPSQFDRNHGTPDELADFDHFFSRPYTRPLHAAHSSQNRKTVEEEKESLMIYRKTVSSPDTDIHGSGLQSVDGQGVDDDPLCSVKDFGRKFGYKSVGEPYLESFLRPRTVRTSHNRVDGK